MTDFRVNPFINNGKVKIAYPPPPPSPGSLCVSSVLPSASVPLSWPHPRRHNQRELLTFAITQEFQCEYYPFIERPITK